MKIAIYLGSLGFAFLSFMATAQQAPAISFKKAPAGRFNTANYPEERKAIEEMSSKQDSSKTLTGDYIGVGADGKIAYSFTEEFRNTNGWKFKSVTPLPGTHFLRVYNADAAVRNVVVDVVFDTPKGDLPLRVARTETYIKQQGKWYMVSAQGTMVLSEEKKEADIKRRLKAK